ARSDAPTIATDAGRNTLFADPDLTLLLVTPTPHPLVFSFGIVFHSAELCLPRPGSSHANARLVTGRLVTGRLAAATLAHAGCRSDRARVYRAQCACRRFLC